MADHKVHPMEYSSQPPTAPPFSRSSSITTNSTIYMPDERYINKEQERSLMHAAADDHKQKDFIYSTPTPLPPEHPSHRAQHRYGRSRCCRCCCCLAVLCSILSAIIIILGIIALVIYLVLQPKTPDFSVTDATITAFNLSSNPIATADTNSGALLYLNADVTFDVKAENPNTKIGIYYDVVDVTLFYEGEEIGTGSIPAFYQGHKNTTMLDLHMKGQDVAMAGSVGTGLQEILKDGGASITLQAQTLAEVRIRVGSWTSRDSKFQIDCNVEMSNPTAPNPHLISKSCSFTVKKLML